MRLAAVSRSRTWSSRAGWSGRKCFAHRENPSFFAAAMEGSEAITRRSNAASNERWPMAPWWWRLTTRPRPGKEPTITPQAKACWSPWRAHGRQGARVSARAGTTRLLASPCARAWAGGWTPSPGQVGSGHRLQDLQPEEIKPHKVRYYLECRDAEFEQKMAEVLCVYRKVEVLKRRPPSRRKPASRWRSSPTTKSRESRPSPRPAGFAARAWRPPDLRT